MLIKKSLRVMSIALLVTVFCVFSGASFSETIDKSPIELKQEIYSNT